MFLPSGSSFLQKLLSTSSNLLKKELHSSNFKGVFQKLGNKASKKAVSAFRTFLEKCLRRSLFLEKLQIFSRNLNTNQQHCSNLQGVLWKLWNNDKKRLILHVSDGIISGKITGGCSVFSLKKEFCCYRFRSSHRTCSTKKGVLRNSAQFTGKHLCQSIFFNKVPTNLLKKTLVQVFSCKLCETSKNNFCIEHLSMTASVVSMEFYKIFRIFFSRKKNQRQLSGLIIYLRVWFSAIHENSLWSAKMIMIIIIMTTR